MPDELQGCFLGFWSREGGEGLNRARDSTGCLPLLLLKCILEIHVEKAYNSVGDVMRS